MPTYQYACNACGYEFETIQSFSDDSLTECPQCKGEIRKVYSAVGVVFKGSGFYKTDSAKSNSTKSEAVKSEAVKSEAVKSEPTKAAPITSPKAD